MISRLLGAPRALEIRTAEDLAAHLRGQRPHLIRHRRYPRRRPPRLRLLQRLRIIAEDIGKLPFIVYRRRGESRERTTGTPEY